MGAYRISRQLIPPAGYLETFAGRANGDKAVLLKRFTQSPSSVDRLLENLRITRGPGLAPVLELGSASDGLWLVSETNEGESLRWVMSTLARASGFIAPNEGLAVVARVANALDALHKQHLIHGDVCPATIFITPRGEVLLHDGGITPLLGAQGESGPARSELNALAPEQLTRAPGTSTDVFRLGLVLYELAVGRPLWSRPTAAQIFEVATKWQGLTREKVKQVPEPWLTLLVSMLSVEPDARPSMEEVIVVLEQAVQQHKWATTDDEISRLFTRAATGRVSAFAADPSSMQDLHLSSLTPQATQPVARIATRKMTREMLAVVRTASVAELPAAADTSLEARAAQLLVERGQISRSKLAVAQEASASSGKAVTGCLVDDGIDEDAIVAAVAELSRTPAITFKKLAEAAPSPEALALVPFPLSRSARAVPLGLKGDKELLVAMADPMDVKALDELKASCGSKSLITFRAGPRALSAARARLYGNNSSTTGSQAPVNDPLLLVHASPPLPPPPPSGLSPKVIDALLGFHGTRGLQAQQLIKLAIGVSKRLGCSPGEQQLIGIASRAMVTAALLAGKAPHEVPKLAEVQERFGFTEADEFIEALQAFPARLPERTTHRAVALAFSFSAHSGEPKPSGSRLGGALSSFRTRLLLPQALFEALAVELSQ